MSERVAVLGCGRVGAAIVRDLARGGEFEVRAIDSRREALALLDSVPGVAVELADLADPGAVAHCLTDCRFAIGAVPGFLGFQTLRTVLEAGVDCVDISFFAEDPFALDELARARGVVAVVDAGVAPGLTHLLAGHLSASWDRLDRFVCGVGGLPAVRTLPWEYKAPFSPVDVLEIYTRPVRTVEGGSVVTRPALDNVRQIEFPGLGTLDAFPTDGLRTLLRTMKCPEMQELTLRYPGHIERIRLLRDAGFLREEPIQLPGGVAVRPIEVTGTLLFPHWQYEPGEEDLTVFFAEAEGLWEERSVRARYTLLDRYDRTTGTSSMARTTGYTATAVLRYLATHRHRLEPGILPPEILGQEPEAFRFVLARLSERGVPLEGPDVR